MLCVFQRERERERERGRERESERERGNITSQNDFLSSRALIRIFLNLNYFI